MRSSPSPCPLPTHAVGRDIGKDKTAIFFHLVYGLLLLSLLFWSCSFSYSLLVATTPKRKDKKKIPEAVNAIPWPTPKD